MPVGIPPSRGLIPEDRFLEEVEEGRQKVRDFLEQVNVGKIKDLSPAQLDTISSSLADQVGFGRTRKGVRPVEYGSLHPARHTNSAFNFAKNQAKAVLLGKSPPGEGIRASLGPGFTNDMTGVTGQPGNAFDTIADAYRNRHALQNQELSNQLIGRRYA